MLFSRLQRDWQKEAAFDEIKKIGDVPRLDQMADASDDGLTGAIFDFELNFIFTTCTDVCPLFTANLAQLQRTLKNEQGNVFFVSISTDPEVDSPKVLKSYAQRYGADFQNWAFLTGSEAQLQQVWKSFDVRVIKKGRGLVQHTNLTTVIDRQGIRRFNFFGEKWPLKDLLRDTSALLEEKPKPNH